MCYNINGVFRKQSKCCNCGFLALRGEMPKLYEPMSLEQIKLLKELELFGSQECTQRGRDRIADGIHTDPSILTCIRHVWSYSDFKDKPVDAFFQLLNSERKCPYFFPYNPSYSPAEHRELQREAKTHRLLIKGMILAALIGAIAAIAAQLIAR